MRIVAVFETDSFGEEQTFTENAKSIDPERVTVFNHDPNLPKTLAHDLLMGEPKAMREAVNIVTGSLMLVDHYRSRHFSPEVRRFLIDSCERAMDQCATSIAAGALPAAAQALRVLSDKWAQAKRELVGDAREI